MTWRPVAWLNGRGGLTFNPTDFEGMSLEPQNRSRWKGFVELNLRPHPKIEVGIRVLAVCPVKASSFQTGSRVLTHPPATNASILE